MGLGNADSLRKAGVSHGAGGGVVVAGPGARNARAAPLEGVLARVEFASDDVGFWVPVGSQQSMGDILDKGSGH